MNKKMKKSKKDRKDLKQHGRQECFGASEIGCLHKKPLGNIQYIAPVVCLPMKFP